MSKTTEQTTAPRRRRTAKLFAAANGYAACPDCKRELEPGEQVWFCEVCDKDCCTVCTETALGHAVICEDCAESKRRHSEKLCNSPGSGASPKEKTL